MAYTAITQNEPEADLLQGPLPPLCHPPDEHLRQEIISTLSNVSKQPTAQLNTFLRSNTLEYYNLVEDRDYDPEDPVAESPVIDYQERDSPEPNLLLDSHLPPSSPRSSTSRPVVRTASGRSIRLRHPTPDLQSLQGAYTGNVERLEQSAERLSLSSSDLGTELRKLDLEQKRRSSVSSIAQTRGSLVRQLSAGSVTNSVRGVNSSLRNGHFSPGAFMTSPRGSIRSRPGSRLRSMSGTARLDEIPEPASGLEDSAAYLSNLGDVPIPTSSLEVHHELTDDFAEGPTSHHQTTRPTESYRLPDRPPSPASTDIYQQATDLFVDFDGVHFVPHARNGKPGRQMSISKPMLASNPTRFEEPPTGEDLVYYPAPIPQTLNLPQRLSKPSAKSDQDKRRTQLLNMISTSDSKHSDLDNARKNKGLSHVPALLRASAFFDQPGESLKVQIQDQSAVTTLDSILDAAAVAPVSAFTDHPIVGEIGAEVYKNRSRKRQTGDRKRRTHTKSTLGPRRESRPFSQFEPSTHPIDDIHENTELEAAERSEEGTPLRASTYQGANEDVPHHGNKGATPMIVEDDELGEGRSSEDEQDSDEERLDGDEEGEEEDEEEDEEEEPVIVGRPTTLLAELQLRKQEQKQRTRTAATAFPNGMHSTLLELDAVAQTQSKARRQKQVTLAWEAPPSFDPDAEDDEDVPLGVLFGSKNPALADNRPMGLMERREMEENEPLSRRRARLRGEAPANLPQNPLRRATTIPHMASGSSIAPADHDSSDEEETLGQRLRRLKDKDRPKSIVAADFTSEMMIEINTKLGDTSRPATAEPHETSLQRGGNDEEEETLGQRKKRLQAQMQSEQPAEMSDNHLKTRKSMASLLQSYPLSNQRKSTVEIHTHLPSSHNPVRPNNNRLSTVNTIPLNLSHSTSGPPQYPSANGIPTYIGTGLRHGNPLEYHQAAMATGPYPYAMVYPPPGGVPMVAPPLDAQDLEQIDRWRQGVMGL